MHSNTNNGLAKCLRRAALTMVAAGTVAAPAVHAHASNDIVLVPPTELPQLARQPGEAMFLHESSDGTQFLYIEHDQGARLAILDVTDPAHVKSKGSVQLDVPGPFDFVSALGSRAELVRFQQGQGSAVLDLHKASAPSVRMLQELTSQGQTLTLGGDAIAVSTKVVAEAQPTQDLQVVEPGHAGQFGRVTDLKQVSAQAVNNDTGTTFLLAEGGLYLIRRPSVEMSKQMLEMDRAN